MEDSLDNKGNDSNIYKSKIEIKIKIGHDDFHYRIASIKCPRRLLNFSIFFSHKIKKHTKF